MEEFNNIEQCILRVLNGSASAEDKNVVESWKAVTPSNEKLFGEYKSIWQILDNYSLVLSINTDDAAKELNKNLNRQKKSKRNWSVYALVASIILPLLIIASLYLYLNQVKSPDIKPVQKVFTSYGVRKQVVLPDSSVVWLNAGSSLEFPMSFSETKREVTLKGEGYFDVVNKPGQPFYVSVENMYVKALGTEFNVTAYPEEELIETTLLSGSVHLVQRKDASERIIAQMRPNQHITYNKNDNKMKLTEESESPPEQRKTANIPMQKFSLDRQVVTNKHTAWIAGRLVFRNDSMEEIARRLGRWYNVKVTLKHDMLKKYSYTATFTNETLEQALELLRLSAPIQYTIKERKKINETSYTKREVIIDIMK
jgi:ferric-dicitrate binding protein FerR (iron transport regulator)